MQISNRKTSIFYDLTRVLLIPLGLIVLAGLLLVLLPQSASDRLVVELQSRRNVSARGEIALLYLGHRENKNQFQIRGVVRNITAEPINQLDAAIRLYGHNRELRETAIVRMETETIAPGEIARFELVYPNYKSEFSSYSVEFKLRSGTVIPYQDMRETQTKTSQAADTGTQSTK